MALKTAFVAEHQTRLLGCAVCDQSQSSCFQRLCTSAGAKGISQVHVPAELSDALSSFGYAAHCFDYRSSERKSYRKKSRSKAKVESKHGEKVYPEELLERPSHSCDDTETFCDANGHNSEEIPECSSSEISNVNGCCVCRNVFSCKPGPVPKCKLHTPKYSIRKKRQDMNRNASSNNNHRAVPKSRGAPDNIAKKKRNNLNTMQRKDQSRLTWKRCQRSRSTESRRETMSLPDHVHFDSISQTSSIPSQQEAFSCDELAVLSNFPSKQKKAATVTRTLDADDTLHKEIHVDASVESSQQVTEAVSIENQLSLSCKKPIEVIHTVELDKSDGYQNNSGRSRNGSWKATQVPLSKSYRRHHESLPFQEQAKGRLFSKDRSTYDPLYPWLKSPRVKPIEEKHLQRFTDRDLSDASCFESSINPRLRRGHDVTQHQSSTKWIPVCKKNSSIPKASMSAVTDENNNDNSPLEHKDICSEGNAISISVPDASSDLRSSDVLLRDDISLLKQVSGESSTGLEVESPKVQHIKKYTRSINMTDDFLHHFVSGISVEQAFFSSYKLQLVSEGVHQTTGYSLAEFEQLLWSSTPAVASSVLSNTYDSSFSDQLTIPILCTEQTPNLSLQTIWDWYEEPGNYGLKVHVNHHHSLEEYVADTTPFHAHFVPLLSAIQIFGNNYQSSSFGKSQEHNLEAHGLEANQRTPLSRNPSVSSSAILRDCLSHIVNSMGNNSLSDDLHDVIKPFDATAPSLLSDAELLFEFFESEQPQRRKPLHNKVMELAGERTSNNQMFGDPSKLCGTNLNDLHPASWFSVAWYPIYRIPEGKMRAAFLTYHSLGFLVQRYTTNDFPNTSPLSFALPVMGLQSYNAQGELWFSPNMEHKSSLGELSSTVLKERLRTLEENALFFARGMVTKDHKMVTNRQPDYEFFMARKGKPPCF